MSSKITFCCNTLESMKNISTVILYKSFYLMLATFQYSFGSAHGITEGVKLKISFCLPPPS